MENIKLSTNLVSMEPMRVEKLNSREPGGGKK